MTFRKGHLLNVLRTFNLRPVSRVYTISAHLERIRVVAIFDNSQLTGSKSINWFLYAPQAIPYLLQIYRKIRTGILPSLICHGLSHGGPSAHTRKKKHVSKNIFSFLRVSTNYHSFVHASWNLFFFSSF